MMKCRTYDVGENIEIVAPIVKKDVDKIGIRAVIHRVVTSGDDGFGGSYILRLRNGNITEEWLGFELRSLDSDEPLSDIEEVLL